MLLDQQLQGQLQAFAAKLDGGAAVATGFLIGVRGFGVADAACPAIHGWDLAGF